MTVYYFSLLVAALFAGQLVLLLYLSVRKKKLDAKEQKIKACFESAADSFSLFMVDPSENEFLKALQTMPYKEIVLERLLNGYVNVTKAGNQSLLVKELAEQFLIEDYQKKINSRQWAIRMNTLYYIEDFHLTSLAPLLLEKLRKSKRLDVETEQLVRTLASLNAKDTLSVLSKFSHVPLRLYIDVFKRLDKQSARNELVIALEQADVSRLKHAAISYIGLAGLIEFLPQVEQELSHPMGELRIQSLKAIWRLQYLSDPELISPFFESESWIERMFAARIAGVMKYSRYQERLNELIGDPVWWVRYSSAEAISLFLDGDIILAHQSQHHPDRYARDMAAQWKSKLLGGRS